jgi:hypothetical protein
MNVVIQQTHSSDVPLSQPESLVLLDIFVGIPQESKRYTSLKLQRKAHKVCVTRPVFEFETAGKLRCTRTQRCVGRR